MKSIEMPKLMIGDLEVRKPVIQGGMGIGVSLSGLASAVANEGGIGVISSIGLGMMNDNKSVHFREANKQLLTDEIRKARKLTKGIIGANIMVAISDYDDLLKVVLEEKADIVFIGAGLPLKLPAGLTIEHLKSVSTKVAVIVSSARAANIIFHSWQKNFNHIPDAVVVEGPKAGGHLGFKKEQIDDPAFKLEKIIPEVIDAVQPYRERFGKNIPVIAAGGIYTGADIYDFMNLGADGVQMATRFVATHECDASPEFKNAFVNCTEEDIMIIQSPVGLPGRAIRNQFLDDVSAGFKKPFKCPWKCLKTCNFKETPYCISLALVKAQKGILDEGFTFAGANAYRVDKIIAVKELFNLLESEYAERVTTAAEAAA